MAANISVMGASLPPTLELEVIEPELAGVDQHAAEANKSSLFRHLEYQFAFRPVGGAFDQTIVHNLEGYGFVTFAIYAQPKLGERGVAGFDAAGQAHALAAVVVGSTSLAGQPDRRFFPPLTYGFFRRRFRTN